MLYLHLAACVTTAVDVDDPLGSGEELLLSDRSTLGTANDEAGSRYEPATVHSPGTTRTTRRRKHHQSRGHHGSDVDPAVTRDVSQLRLAATVSAGLTDDDDDDNSKSADAGRHVKSAGAGRTTKGEVGGHKSQQQQPLRTTCAIRIPVHHKVTRHFFPEIPRALTRCRSSRTLAKLPNGRTIVVTVEQGRSTSSPITLRIQALEKPTAAASTSSKAGAVAGGVGSTLQQITRTLDIHRGVLGARIAVARGALGACIGGCREWHLLFCVFLFFSFFLFLFVPAHASSGSSCLASAD